MKVVVLLSGGLDSAACVAFYQKLDYDVEGLFCDYGQPAATEEYKAAQRVADYFDISLHTVEVDNLSIPNSGEISGRNALLVMIALSYFGYGIYKIALGIHAGTSYADCSIGFVDATNRMLDCYASGMICLEAPFVEWQKGAIAEYVKGKGIPYQITYSCERGVNPPCGCCGSCADRRRYLSE